jgi:hypothetical protein
MCPESWGGFSGGLKREEAGHGQKLLPEWQILQKILDYDLCCYINLGAPSKRRKDDLGA